jgi:hypothetical protein
LGDQALGGQQRGARGAVGGDGERLVVVKLVEALAELAADEKNLLLQTRVTGQTRRRQL